MTKKKTGGFWNLLDKIQGDKVIWIVVIFLTLLSIVALFSSTSLDKAVMDGEKTRLNNFIVQVGMVTFGFLLMYGVYLIPGMKLFKWFSQWGFLISAFFLAIPLLNINLGFAKPGTINGASRFILVFGLQVNPTDIARVLMVMYLAWAIDTWKGHNFTIANWASTKYHWMGWLSKPFWQGVIYIFIPIVISSVGMISGSVSAVLFVGTVMFATLFVGGFSIKDTIIYGIVLICLFLAGFGLYKVTEPAEGEEPSKIHAALAKVFSRIDTAEARLEDRFGETTYVDENGVEHEMTLMEQIRSIPNADERQKFKDSKTQKVGAKIAIKEGGFFGKGPGRSTQKYRVAVMFGDYMYSFLIEEYGMWMAILVLIMYVSLLARGSRLAMLCEKTYSRAVVAGLTLLISGQAMMHMLINVGILPITGQTLPIVSDGKGSLLMFYFAFGVLLSISKTAKKQMDKEIQKAEEIIPDRVSTGDEVADSLADMDSLDSID